MLYFSVCIIAGTFLIFVLIICYQKLIYIYVFTTFLILLGFSFYLLKNINFRIANFNIQANSLFYNDDCNDDYNDYDIFVSHSLAITNINAYYYCLLTCFLII